MFEYKEINESCLYLTCKAQEKADDVRLTVNLENGITPGEFIGDMERPLGIEAMSLSDESGTVGEVFAGKDEVYFGRVIYDKTDKGYVHPENFEWITDKKAEHGWIYVVGDIGLNELKDVITLFKKWFPEGKNLCGRIGSCSVKPAVSIGVMVG